MKKFACIALLGLLGIAALSSCSSSNKRGCDGRKKSRVEMGFM